MLGAGLLAGTWYGRGRGLIFLGVLLTIATAVATVADVPISGGIGERDWAPRTAGQLEREYHLGVGEIHLDLRRLELDGATRHVDVTVGLGHLWVDLPRGIAVRVKAHTGMGELAALGRDDEGVDVSSSRRVDGDNGALVLDLRVGMGRLEVNR